MFAEDFPILSTRFLSEKRARKFPERLKVETFPEHFKSVIRAMHSSALELDCIQITEAVLNQSHTTLRATVSSVSGSFPKRKLSQELGQPGNFLSENFAF